MHLDALTLYRDAIALYRDAIALQTLLRNLICYFINEMLYLVWARALWLVLARIKL
ncbi:hypothetical protein NIES4075_46790 [Tolypothrix sp. NIES-4075]|uniref:hypothetical protein n=1 Tax=Tolypothrix sp. NIES-4075 TaxID=2005459 RepID=UPI000B7629DA|nr:hypothetical protein [Tolypothrix sp. NIES-4075]GAX43664.1 hypothetical protein NIES4075_46790 [Tolypothrix sp. NIES-4075]